MSPLERLRNLEDEHRRKYAPELPTSREIAGANPRDSLYLQDLEKRAAREHKRIQDVFQGDQDLLSSGDFPCAACLRPEEVLQAAFGCSPLPTMLRNHLDQCLYCRAIVARSKAVESPRATAIARELAKMPDVVPTPTPVSDWWQAPGLPLIRGAMLSLCLLAVMTSVLNVWFMTQVRRSGQVAVKLSYDVLKKAVREDERIESDLEDVRSSLVEIEKVQRESGDLLLDKPKISDLIGKFPDFGRRDISASLHQLEEAMKSYGTSKAF